jgi:alkylhydroperoxidase family enzyme
MQSRMNNPAAVLNAYPAIQDLMKLVFGSGVDPATMNLVALRVAQMNECRLCILDAIGKGDDRLDRVIDWQVQEVFTPPERAALRLAEETTALGAEYDSVSDGTWAEVEAQFDERQRAGLVLMIGVMNMFTRMNVATRQTSADWA